MQTKDTRLTFRLSKDLGLRLAELSRFARRHQSDLVRAAVQQYVDYYAANPEELPRG